MEILKGIPVSPGFAIGEAFILDSEESVIPRRFISQPEVETEVTRFHAAVEKAKADIRELQRRVSDEIGEEAAPIFDAHVMILSDKPLHDEVLGRIRNNRFAAEYAVSRSLRKFEKAFLRTGNSYLAQRITDLRDIEQRMLQALLGERKEEIRQLDRQVVLLAHDLTPSQTAAFDREKVIGFATDVGGMTGHTAIVARAREIPAVVGLGTVSTDVSTGDLVVVDGNRGIVVVNPDEKTMDAYRRMMKDFHVFEEALIGEKDLPAVTLDGCRVSVAANIEFPREIETVLQFGGEGVGLYRTEFLYLESEVEPDEAMHFEAYERAISMVGSLPIAIRTLDLGADKFFHIGKSTVDILHERNPALGCRAIRYCLRYPDVFRKQIRAICRASALGNVKMMIPMVSYCDEVIAVRQMVAEVQERLADEDVPFNPDMPIGIMVEVPSVALTIERFCDHCDFFSIGTNDLTQYVLAADRTNEHVAGLYWPGHPSILRLIREVLEKSAERGIPVSLCGEMAGDAAFVVFLLGLGLRNFSVSPPLIPEVKKLIRYVTLDKAQEVSDHALSLGTSREVMAYLRGVTREYQPNWNFM
jgi:phosphotransferase system enzyme I (PtsI)